MKANIEKEKLFKKFIDNGEIWADKYGNIYKKNGTCKYHLNNTGYYRLSYKSITIFVHRLVWIYFKGLIYDDKLQINHIDGDKLNNTLENLEIVDNKTNTKHAILMGLRTPISEKTKQYFSEKIRGCKNINAKFTQSDVILYRYLYKMGKINIKTISEKYDITQRSVKNMLSGKTYN